MNCEQLAQRLSRWIDGQLPEPEQHSVLEHLRACERCALAAEELALVNRVYAEAGEIAPAANFRSAVHGQIRSSDKQRWRAGMTWRGPITRLLAWPNLRLRPLLSLGGGIATLITITLAVLSFVAVHSIQTEARAGVVMSCQVKGMMCDGCAKSVRSILKQLPGVLDAKVDPDAGRARLILKRGAKLTEEDLTTALNRTKGFRLMGLSVERQDKE